jgi:hypothetical protein
VPSGRRRSGAGCTTAGTVGSRPTRSGWAARRVHHAFPGRKPRRSARPETPSSRRAQGAKRQGSAAPETRLGLVVWSGQSSSSPAVPLACHIGRTSSVPSGQPRSCSSHRLAGRLSLSQLERNTWTCLIKDEVLRCRDQMRMLMAGAWPDRRSAVLRRWRGAGGRRKRSASR